MLPETTNEAARRYGEQAAFVTAEGWPVSYTDLDRLSDEAAVGLTRRGAGPGDVVVLALPSTVDYVVAYLALAKIGAVTAGVNPSLAPPERANLIELADARLVLATSELAEGIAPERAVELVRPGEDVDGLLADLRVPARSSSGGTPPALPADDGRAVAIVFTSGTTGVPKGAVFTNLQLRNITAIDVGEQWGGGSDQLASTQFAHIGIMTKLPWYLRLATTTHLLRRWRAADVLRMIAELRMTSFGAVAPQVALLLRVPEFDSYDLSCVQGIIVGAGPSSPALVDEARRRFDAGYSIRYSSTESGGVGTGTAFGAPDEEALYTVGRPRPGVELTIRDEDGRVLPDGEHGEVCLRSGAVMDRYWRDTEATATTLRDGWLFSGDLGTIDDIGCLRLVGRRKEMFIRGGYNIFPMEVESVLSAHPAVSEIAIVPRPDPVMGEVGVAVVVPRPGVSPPSVEDLRAFGEGRIATWKLPEHVRVVDALPLTAMSKLDRRGLAAAEQAAATGA